MSGESHLRFDCFGGTVGVHVRTAGGNGDALCHAARSLLLDGHRLLSRFDPDSELCRLNDDPRSEVLASPLLRRLAAAVGFAGERSGGLVDATMLEAIERAGYADSLAPLESGAPLRPLLDGGGERRAALPRPAPDWHAVRVDDEAGTVIRPPGVKIDGGGIAKGLLADLAAEALIGCPSFAVDCCGDICFGGTAEQPRRIRVDDPFSGGSLHEFTLLDGGVATSGISRRSWLGPGSRPAHQILDPSSGLPAFTGIVQATALAPTALLAEVLAKSALLSGPASAADWLPYGGAYVDELGEVGVVPATESLPERVTA